MSPWVDSAARAGVLIAAAVAGHFIAQAALEVLPFAHAASFLCVLVLAVAGCGMTAPFLLHRPRQAMPDAREFARRAMPAEAELLERPHAGAVDEAALLALLRAEKRWLSELLAAGVEKLCSDTELGALTLDALRLEAFEGDGSGNLRGTLQLRWRMGPGLGRGAGSFGRAWLALQARLHDGRLRIEVGQVWLAESGGGSLLNRGGGFRTPDFETRGAVEHHAGLRRAFVLLQLAVLSGATLIAEGRDLGEGTPSLLGELLGLAPTVALCGVILPLGGLLLALLRTHDPHLSIAELLWRYAAGLSLLVASLVLLRHWYGRGIEASAAAALTGWFVDALTALVIARVAVAWVLRKTWSRALPQPVLGHSWLGFAAIAPAAIALHHGALVGVGPGLLFVIGCGGGAAALLLAARGDALLWYLYRRARFALVAS